MKKAKTVEVEVITSEPDQKTLAKLAPEIEKREKSMLRKGIDFKYEVVALGLLYKKAQVAFRCDPGYMALSSGGNVSTSNNGQEDGFYAWCAARMKAPYETPEERKKFRNNARSIRNYMIACENAGLTSESTLADVAAAKKRHILHDKTLTELYRLKDKTETKDNGDGETAPNLHADVLADLASVCDSVRALREDFKPDEFDTACNTLRDTLAEMTGEALVHREHGEIVAHEDGAFAPVVGGKNGSGKKRGGRR